MQRRIIKLGKATFVTSLPSKWVKRFNLKQGDYLEVEEKQNLLLLKTTSDVSVTTKEIDLTNLDTKLIERALRAAYIKGYEEIKITFKKDKTTHLKTGKEISILTLIEELVSTQLIGMEIIEQRIQSCTIKDITQLQASEFDNVLRRIFLILKSFSQDTLEKMKTKSENSSDFKAVRNTITRLSNYAKRLLHRAKHEDTFTTSQNFFLINTLNQIASVYELISAEAANNKNNIHKDVLEAFTLTNISLNSFYELFYKFSQERTLEIMVQRNSFFSIANKLQYDTKTKTSDVLLLSRLSVIIMYLSYITETTINLHS